MKPGKNFSTELIVQELAKSIKFGYIRYNLDGGVEEVNSTVIKLLGYKSLNL